VLMVPVSPSVAVAPCSTAQRTGMWGPPPPPHIPRRCDVGLPGL